MPAPGSTWIKDLHHGGIPKCTALARLADDGALSGCETAAAYGANDDFHEFQRLGRSCAAPGRGAAAVVTQFRAGLGEQFQGGTAGAIGQARLGEPHRIRCSGGAVGAYAGSTCSDGTAPQGPRGEAHSLIAR